MLPFLVHKILTFYINDVLNCKGPASGPEGLFLRLSLTIFVYSFPQNIVYFLMLPFLVHKIFTFYINDMLNCKGPASGPKGLFLRLSPSIFVYSSPQNAVYFLTLPFLVHKIFTFYINDVLNCKCPASGPKG